MITMMKTKRVIKEYQYDCQVYEDNPNLVQGVVWYNGLICYLTKSYMAQTWRDAERDCERWIDENG